MPFAVELTIESALADHVRDVWAELVRRQLGVDLLEAGATPHVTIGIWDEIDEPRAIGALEALARRTIPITFEFGAIGTFPTGIVYLAPVVRDDALELNRSLPAALGDAAWSPWPYYLPGSWVPHCTLAEKLPAPRIGEAVQLACDALKLPQSATPRSLQLVQFPPIRLLMTAPLAGEAP